MESIAYREVRKVALKLDKELRHKDFLLKCKKFDVIPKCFKINNKLLRKEFNHLIVLCERRILRKAIKKKFSKISLLRTVYYEKIVFLANLVINEEMKLDMLKKLEYIRKREDVKHKEIHDRKFEKILVNKKEKLTNTQEIPLINMTDYKINEETENVLKKGFKFIPNGIRIDKKDLIPKVENILEKISEPKKSEIRIKCRNIIGKEIRKRRKRDKEMFQNLKNLRENMDLAIIRTDKTNKIALLNAKEYNEKMKKQIETLGCKEILNDPTNKIYQKIKDFMKNAKWLQGRYNPKLNNAPIAPRMFGRLKDHKPGVELRPIVAKNSGPTYEIEKYMAKVYKELLAEKSRSLNSTESFINEIKKMKIEDDCIMATLDVKALFPSIDIHNTTVRIMNRIDGMNVDQDIKDTLKEATKIITNFNYFRFDNKYYEQKKGAPMGSPTSGFIAEFEMRPYEEEIIKNEKRIIFWKRYVDDIFIIWKSDGKELHNFIENLNNKGNNLKFTSEVEDNNTLAFLDVKIIRNEDGTLDTTIYRKQHSETVLIPNECRTYKPYKWAALNFYIRRAYKICSKNFLLREEIKWIKKVANAAGYPINEINRLINNIKLKMKNKPEEDENEHENRFKIAGKIPHIPKLINTLKRDLKKEGWNIAIEQNKNIFNLIRRDRDHVEELDQSGIYKIPLTLMDNNEELYYIGETSRKINIRVKEHMSDLKYNRKTTALAQLATKTNILPHFKKTSRIANYNNMKYAKLRETIEIISHGNKAINEKLTLCKTWNELIK